jgi:hypothetical protein
MITLFSQLGNTLLEKLFPPELGWIDGTITGSPEPEEQGWAGNVQEKPYRDGIDRMAKEGLS